MSLNLVQIIVERIFPQSATQTTEVTENNSFYALIENYSNFK
jgi:hypothetical protein